MSMWSLLSSAVLSLHPSGPSRLLHASAVLSGLPGVKKRKKLDPAIIKMREERRKVRIDRALRKMAKKPRIPRPLLELEVSPDLVKEMPLRQRKVGVMDPAVQEQRALLLKDWTRFCGQRHRREIAAIDTVIFSQQRALEQLRVAAPKLYVQAIQFDAGLEVFKMRGPTRTPPIAGYIQDGTYVDTTKKFEVQYADMKKFMTELLSKGHRKKKKKDDDEE